VLWSRQAAVAVLVAVCTVSVTAACSSSGSGSGSGSAAGSGGGSDSKSSITVGFNDSLSGANVSSGTSDIELAKAAVAYANAQGGVDGHKLVLKALDSGDIGSGKAGSNQLQLSQSHAAFVMGPTVSNDCDEVVPIAASTTTPTFCSFVDYDTLVPAKQYVFAGAIIERAQAEPIINFMKQKTGKAHPRIAVLDSFTDGSVDYGTKVKNIAGQLGAKAVYVASMSQQAVSVSSYADDIIAAHPDALSVDIFQNFIPPLVAQLRSAGLNIPIIGLMGDVTDSAQAALKDPNVYALSGANWLLPGDSSNTAQVNQLITALKQSGATTAADINGAAGPTVLVPYLAAVKALQSCGWPCSPSELTTKLDSTTVSIPGLVSDFGYSPQLHLGYKTVQFWAWDTAKSMPVQVAANIPLGTTSLTSP
jgi:ABC-type branched-subunit amino acid transport system substrate-binding protein